MVISGGQTGVDIAALRAAKAVGLRTGGWMPLGFRTEAGPRPEYVVEFGMRSTASPEYPMRTRKNIDAASFTLIVGANVSSRGSALTQCMCESADKPHRVEQYAFLAGQPPEWATEETARMIRRYEIVNVAGNRDPALERPVEEWLREVFRLAMEMNGAASLAGASR